MKQITGLIWASLWIGCGGGERQEQAAAEGQSQAAPRVAACEVLSMAEVGEVIGTPVQRTEPREVADPSDSTRYMTACTYIAERGQALMTTTLMLRRSPEVRDPAAAFNDYVEGVRRETATYSLEPVAEVGPGAGWHAETTTLWVFRPGWMVSLAIDKAAPAPLEGAKQLTSKALERLPSS